MNKPILLGVDGQAREIIEHYAAGIYFEPENEKALIEAIQALRNDEALQISLGKAGTDLAKAFDRKTLANKMAQILVDFYQSKFSAREK